MAYSRDESEPIETQLLVAMEYLIENGIDLNQVAEVDIKDSDISSLAGTPGKTQQDLHDVLAAMGVGQGLCTPTITVKANGTAASDPDANGAALAASSTPYKTATVMAIKGGANAYTPGAANAGNVHIATADSLASAIPLAPGTAMELPPNCDLADFFLIVENANDAVVISYTTVD